MKNEKIKIKNEERQEKGRYATKLICTKQPQRLIESGKSMYIAVLKSCASCTKQRSENRRAENRKKCELS